MKRTILLINIILLVCISSYTQGEFFTINHGSKVILYESKVEKSYEYYLSSQNKKLNVYLKDNDDPIMYQGKIDLVNKCVEIEVLERYGELPYFRMDSLIVLDNEVINNTKFYNGLIFGHNKADLLLELMHDGDSKLFKTYQLKTKRANYNPVLATGSKTDSYVKKDVFYFYNSRLGLVEIPSKNKEFKLFLKTNTTVEFKKLKNKLKPNKLDDLILLSNYLKINKA
jgi:hypothetical protein